MDYLTKVEIDTQFGKKAIEVYCCDIEAFDQDIDILTISAFWRSYSPSPHTVFNALEKIGISVAKMSSSPEVDLRDFCNVWLTKAIDNPTTGIHRIGCVEMSRYTPDRSLWGMEKDALLNTLKAYFRMLDVIATQEIKMETVALPLLGTGDQRIDAAFIIMPIVSECIALLKRNERVKKILFVDKNVQHAYAIAKALDNSYFMMKNKAPQVAKIDGDYMAFISYSSKDKNIADNLRAKLEARGMKCWYAPRDVNRDNYAQAIVEAIESCTHFVVIISEHSLKSEHVLNEIDLAFNETSRHIQFRPIRIDHEQLGAAMKYYLSRKHWMDATVPPIENRLEEFADRLIRGIQSDGADSLSGANDHRASVIWGAYPNP